MYETLGDRLASGFTGFDWWLLIVLSLVAALIMRKWPQWPAAAAIAFFADAAAPFFYRWATGVPPDFAFDFAISRLDERGGIVVLLRLALYMVAIGGIFWVKRKYGRK
jgi:hypothetical protein